MAAVSKAIAQEATLLQKNYSKNNPGITLDRSKAIEQATQTINKRSAYLNADVFNKAVEFNPAQLKNIGKEQKGEMIKAYQEFYKKSNSGKEIGMLDAWKNLQKSENGDFARDFLNSKTTKKTAGLADDAAKGTIKKTLEKAKNLPTWGKVAIGVGAAALALIGVNALTKPKEQPQEMLVPQGQFDRQV